MYISVSVCPTEFNELLSGIFLRYVWTSVSDLTFNIELNLKSHVAQQVLADSPSWCVSGWWGSFFPLSYDRSFAEFGYKALKVFSSQVWVQRSEYGAQVLSGVLDSPQTSRISLQAAVVPCGVEILASPMLAPLQTTSLPITPCSVLMCVNDCLRFNSRHPAASCSLEINGKFGSLSVRSWTEEKPDFESLWKVLKSLKSIVRIDLNVCWSWSVF